MHKVQYKIMVVLRKLSSASQSLHGIEGPERADAQQQIYQTQKTQNQE